jgi:hypothetical protein
MTSSVQPCAYERERAFDRLRSLTTGIAVAGLAGTAGFGALAAVTYAGQPGATSVQDLQATVPDSGPITNFGDRQSDRGGGESFEGNGSDDSGGLTNPFSANSGLNQPRQSVRNGGSFSRGHVSTGGSR